MGNFRGPEGNKYRITASLVAVAIAILACDSQATPPTLVPLQPTITAPQLQPTDLMISPTMEMSPATGMAPTLEIPPTLVDDAPPFAVLTKFPQMWQTGEDSSQLNVRMSDRIKADKDARPDQYAAASEVLRQDYINAVFNIEFVTDPSSPMGGTGTFIGINRATNESIFLTDTHVIDSGPDQFLIKQPHTGLNEVATVSDATVARSPAGDFNDIAVVKLPFIPNGVSAFPVTGSNLCVTEEPPENMVTRAFAFPYINGGPRYTPYLMQGNVETLTDESVGLARCWYGNIEGISPGIYIPTTMPVRVGASGALVLNENQEGIGLVIGMSPHGALVKPLSPALLQDLVAQTGFNFGP